MTDTPPFGTPLPHRRRWPLAAALAAAGLAVVGAGLYIGGPVLTPRTPASTRRNVVTEPKVVTYLCPQPDSGVLLQWEQRPSDITGTVQIAELAGTPPSQTISATTSSFTGHIDGDSLSVNFGSHNLFGRLTAETLTLNVPQSDGTIRPESCSRSSVAEWNALIGVLHTTADANNKQANEEAAAQQKAQNVASAQQSLSSDINTLAQDAAQLDNNTIIAGDLRQMSADLANEQQDWMTEQADSCYNVSGDSGTVSGDQGTVDGDQGSLQGDESSLQSYEQTVQQDLSAVQSDLSTLKSLSASPATSPAAAIAAGQKALTDTAKAITYGNQQAASMVAQAAQISNEAANFANAQSC